jgi:hypothetical protein
MISAYRWVSGLVEVDLAWREPSAKVLRQPSTHEPKSSRIIFHETLHHWQQLASGFLARIAVDDWRRLLDHEAGRAVGLPTRRRLYTESDAHANFSPRDLSECLARFWDVHVIGPHLLLDLEFNDANRALVENQRAEYDELRERGLIQSDGLYSSLAFDLAMEIVGGGYAAPYIHVREQYSNPLVAAAVFPFACHYALQTEQPVRFFIELLERSAQHVACAPRGHRIDFYWWHVHLLVRKEAVRLSERLGLGPLVAAGRILAAGELDDHPFYEGMKRLYWFLLGSASNTEGARRYGRRLGEDVPMDIATMLLVDYYLATPGEPSNRSTLIEWLAPPAVRFNDGRIWALSELHWKEVFGRDDALRQTRRELVTSAQSVEERWERFRREVRGY